MCRSLVKGADRLIYTFSIGPTGAMKVLILAHVRPWYGHGSWYYGLARLIWSLYLTFSTTSLSDSWYLLPYHILYITKYCTLFNFTLLKLCISDQNINSEIYNPNQIVLFSSTMALLSWYDWITKGHAYTAWGYRLRAPWSGPGPFAHIRVIMCSLNPYGIAKHFQLLMHWFWSSLTNSMYSSCLLH